MNNRNYFYIIPLVMLEAVIQLLFFWLAPAVVSRWVVYAFWTVVSVAHLTLVFILGNKKGVRRSVPTILCGSLILLFLVATGIFMLATNGTFRNTIFLMSIITILYMAAMCLMVFSIEPDHAAPRIPENPQNMDGGNYPYARNSAPMPYTVSVNQSRNAWPVREMPTRPATGRRDGYQAPPLPNR